MMATSRKAEKMELVRNARERVLAWRERHDRESLITGSADGWLVLDTIDALIEDGDNLAGILTDFVVDVHGEDCRLDHHGNCQAHFLQPGMDCLVRRARQALGLDLVRK